MRSELLSRHLAQVSSSEAEEGDNVPLASRLLESNRMKRKLDDNPKEKQIDEDSESGSEEGPQAEPIGGVIKVSGEGKGRKIHYASFEYDGNQYDLEDSVLVVPEDPTHQKPYVAIIKAITQTPQGAMMVTGQWFYRPEEVEKRGCGNREARTDARVLYYSFNQDEVAAESIMHKCIVHFIPPNKQIPQQKKHPGFVVQKVYDSKNNNLFKLTLQDHIGEEDKRYEIDLLVENTLSRIPDLPDLEPHDY